MQLDRLATRDKEHPFAFLAVADNGEAAGLRHGGQ
jgi:hypothetical protein